MSIEQQFTTLAVQSSDDLSFGRSKFTVTAGFGLELGNGAVYPELNFTLPTMTIDGASWKEVTGHYHEIGTMFVRTAKRLKLPGLMVEFELLPPMTEHPEWGAEITAILHSYLAQAHKEFGLPCALRVTPTDIRDMTRPPELRTGAPVQALLESFERCASAGADVLSIESVGSKEVHDHALLYGEVDGLMLALGVLAPRDMEFLWGKIVGVCTVHRIVPGGDSACGFANTAMQLATQGMLPEVLATVIRAASAVRSLVAYECGARGPSKDCAYEGPVIKAITGTPIAMEGKSASCAHFSPVGNVAAAMCDLWSNESVQNVRLLSGQAPEAFLELLAYDCRLFNQALHTGTEKTFQGLLVESDVHMSPQAYILSPDATMRIASAIVGEANHYRMTLAAAKEAVLIIRDGMEAGDLVLDVKEKKWLDRIDSELAALPSEEMQLLESLQGRYGHLFAPASYGL